MGKHHHRSPTKQSSANTSVQHLRQVIARILTDSWNQESATQLKQWLMKYLPSIGLAATGTSQWKDIRDSICLDQKLLEKLCCVFQDARDSSLILLMSQLFGELFSSKRAAKLLVQCGLTLAVLCQIRVCCCLSSNSASMSSSAIVSNWQSSSGGMSESLSLASSLSMQCSFLASSSSNADMLSDKQTFSLSTSGNGSNSNNGSNNNLQGLQCSPQVAISLHQLACRVFPLDSRYNTKARATGAILGTLLAAKTLVLDRKALPVLLCCLRFYVNSNKNLKLLGTNGAITLVHRLIGTLSPRQSRLLKISLELLSALLKSSSNCVRFVQTGGVNTLMTTFESVHRSDVRCRQLQIRRIVLRCLLMITQIKAGRSAVIQCGAIQTLYAICKELPARQELDGIFLTAMGVIKSSAGPRRLPVASLYSPYSFDASAHYSSSDLASRANMHKSKSTRRAGAQLGVAAGGSGGQSPASSSQNLSVPQQSRQLQQNPSTDDDSPISTDEEDIVDDEEDTEFVMDNCRRRSFLRNGSSDERPDGGEIDGGCVTGADDSDSDCGAGDAGLASGSQNDPAAALLNVPLESDPIVLSSYDMFFPEVRDLSLTNGAAATASVGVDGTIAADNLTAVIAGNGSVPEDFVTQLGLRTLGSTASLSVGSSNNSPQLSNPLLTSPQRAKATNAFPNRKSTAGKQLLSRRSSEMNGPETQSYGYVTNSIAASSSEIPNRVSSFLPLSLIGEHITSSNSERVSSTSSSGSSRDGSTTSIGGFAANRDTARYARLASGNKRLAIWNKIPYPCLNGFLPLPTTEPQLAMPSVNIRRIVSADCDRFLQKVPPDILNEVVYDLDAIVATSSVANEHSSFSRSNTSVGGMQPPSSSASSSSVLLGNDDLQRIGRPAMTGDTGLMFNSLFECGNLRRAIRVREYEYDLILTPDVSTNHHLQWFYFEVYNTPNNGQPIRFNIINCEKPKSQYEKGMTVLQFSVTEAALGRPHWRRVGQDVCYYKNFYEHPTGELPLVSYYTLTFSISFEHSYDVCYLAYHYPYSYTSMLYELESIQSRVLPSDVYYTCQQLCLSEMSNAVPIITITSSVTNPNNNLSSSSSLPGIAPAQQPYGSQSSLPTMISSNGSSNGGPIYRSQQQRPYIILTSRVHPGESNSSWMMRGVISFLLSDTQSARRARQSFIFKIIPMLNVDGVLNGNHRCSLYGDDLNRSWTRPSPITAPSIFHTKRLLAWLRFRRRPILTFVDFHGHSRKKNIFVLGCSPNQSWRRRDVCNPAVDPVTGDEDSRWRLLPVLLAATSPCFSLQDCCFMIERAKEPTARVVCWRQVGLIATYTLEATFCGFDQGTYRGLQVTPVHLQEMGADLIRCFEPLSISMGRPSVNPRYGESFATASQQQISAAANAPPFPAAARAVGGLRNIGMSAASCDESSSSASSSSSEASVRDDNSEDELSMRTTVMSTKTITFVSKKY